MFVPEKKQLNKFVKVACPKPKDLFMRIGSRNPLGTGSNDGSDYSDVVDFNTSKLDSFAQVARDERSRLYDEYAHSQKSDTTSEPTLPSEPSE